MMILTHPASRPSSSATARQKIEQALRLVGPAREDNASLKDVFEGAHQKLEGFEPHVKAIEFDRPTKDVSAHGTALRGKAGEADQTIDGGQPRQSALEQAAEQIEVLIDGALADLGNENYKARARLGSAKRDIDFARESTISGSGISLRHASNILSQELDPYLTEVEEDAPGRDVGRFADDIEEMWRTADSHLSTGTVDVKFTDKSLAEVRKELEAARDAL